MKKKYPLIPSYLPLVRDSIIETRRAEFAAAHCSAPPTATESIANEKTIMDMRLSQLWWVSEDMTSVVVDALNSGEQPPPDPTPHTKGLIVYGGGIAFEGRRFEAVSWNEDWFLLAWEKSPDDEAYTRTRCPVTTVGDIDFGPLDLPLFKAVMFTLSLSAEPRLASVAPGTWNGNGPMPRGLSKEDVSNVKVVELRRNTKTAWNGGGEPGMEYSHRWIVSGHYRNQACGKGRRDRKRIWVPPYVKGPEDKPLVKKDTVFVWRR